MKKTLKQADIASFFNVSNTKKTPTIPTNEPKPTSSSSKNGGDKEKGKEPAKPSKSVRDKEKDKEPPKPNKSPKDKEKDKEPPKRSKSPEKKTENANSSKPTSQGASKAASSSSSKAKIFDTDSSDDDIQEVNVSKKQEKAKAKPTPPPPKRNKSPEKKKTENAHSSKPTSQVASKSGSSSRAKVFDTDSSDDDIQEVPDRKKREKAKPTPPTPKRNKSPEKKKTENAHSSKSTSQRASKAASSSRATIFDSDSSDDDIQEVPAAKKQEKTKAEPTPPRPTSSKRRVIESDSDDEADLPKTPEVTKKGKQETKAKVKPIPTTSKRGSAKRLRDDDSDGDSLPPPKAIKSEKVSKGKSVLKTPAKTSDEPSTPGQTPEEKKRIQSSNYFKFISRGGPKHLGSKEVPVGAPDCLNGLTFVTTGVLDSFERDDIVTIVTKYGGRVTSAISRKTSFLLVGDEPGESKIKKAKELNIPKMTEDEFLGFIRKSNPNQPVKQESQFFGVDDDDEVEKVEEERMEVEEQEPTPSKSTRSSPRRSPIKRDQPEPTTPSKSTRSASKSSPSRSRKDKSGDPEPPRTPSKSKSMPRRSSSKRSRDDDDDAADSVPPSKTARVKGEETRGDVKRESPKGNLKSTPEEKPSTQEVPPPPKSPRADLMWVDKYKPVSLRSVVGQAGDKSNANKLMKWLQTWFSFHGRSDEKIKAGWPGLRDPEGKTFKAALLSGPPGIGKTTTAHLCCKEIGYDYFELNASDTRNKKGLHDTLSDALTSEALIGFKQKSRRHILIMDEVDGMSGNEDRGGVQELIGLIKSSRVPIICICNDRNHPKIRSLANYCFDLRFNKPTNEQLKAMIQSICFKEKMKLPADPVQQLITSTDHDVRQILHQLQLIKESTTPGGSLYNPKKDLRFGPWDVCRKVFSAFEHRGMSFQDKSNLFFQDYSIGPLFVQENYLKWTPLGAGGNRHKHLDLIRKSAEALANGDLVENLLRRSNNWSLLPTQAVFSSILPGQYMEGDEVSGIEFPRWLGQNSHKNKMSRLLQQLHNHVHLHISGSLEALNMDYLPYLRRSIVNPLIQGETEASVSLMQEYSLLREDLDSIIEVSVWPGGKNPMEQVETKTKAAFTRQVNKEILPYSIMKVTKGRGVKVEEAGEDELAGLEEEEEDEENSEDEGEAEDLEKDAMIKIRTTKKKGSDKGDGGPSTSKGSSRQGSTKSNSSSTGRSKSSKKK